MTRRRDFIKGIPVATLAMLMANEKLFANVQKRSRMKAGLVTYLWGKDWDVPTIIANCEKTNLLGVELRTQHKHGVEPTLTAAQRKEVKARFSDSRVEFIGYGSNAEFDNPDPAILKQNLDFAKELVRLCKDVGGSGVKVKPNKFHPGVAKEKTIEQIGKALKELGAYASDYGQLIRLEVHGRETQELPNIKAIMDVADHRNVAVCWNCNPEDLNGQGLAHNFDLVKDRLGDTIHIHEMNSGSYPYEELLTLLLKEDYSGWLLWECHSDPQNKVEALLEQQNLLKNMLTKVQKSSAR